MYNQFIFLNTTLKYVNVNIGAHSPLDDFIYKKKSVGLDLRSCMIEDIHIVQVQVKKYFLGTGYLILLSLNKTMFF